MEHVRWSCVSLSMNSGIWTENYSTHSSLYRHSCHPYNNENMAKNCYTKSSFHDKPWNMSDEHVSLYRWILEFEHKIIPRIHHSIDRVVVLITTKIWPKIAIFFCFHAKSWIMFNKSLSIDRWILEFEQKFLPCVHHSINQFVVPRKTKIWPKTARQNLVSA